jgi:hypothetical protein
MINESHLIDRLASFGVFLPSVISSFSDQDIRWKPADGAWSILEVVRHLLDEEVLDFRKRLRQTIVAPDQPWPEIDPEKWAVDLRYNIDPPVDPPGPWLTKFVAERKTSVAFLRGLDEGVWSTAYQHPKYGPIRAGDLLAAWAAHDALHLRQIAKRMYQLAQFDAGEFSTIYAGEWSA